MKIKMQHRLIRILSANALLPSSDLKNTWEMREVPF